MVQFYLQTAAQFLVCLGVQSLIWRWLWRKKGFIPRQIAMLLVLFGGGPFVLFLFTQSLDQLILGTILGSVYVMSFPAAAAQSPTILIVEILNRKGPSTSGELFADLEARVRLTEDRIDDLVADGLGKRDLDKFQVSFAGRTLGRAFWTYRRLLNLPAGDG